MRLLLHCVGYVLGSAFNVQFNLLRNINAIFRESFSVFVKNKQLKHFALPPPPPFARRIVTGVIFEFDYARAKKKKPLASAFLLCDKLAQFELIYSIFRLNYVRFNSIIQIEIMLLHI